MKDMYPSNSLHSSHMTLPRQLSLLDTFELGDELLREFMTALLVGTRAKNKPSVAFSSPFPKVKAKTFLNL